MPSSMLMSRFSTRMAAAHMSSSARSLAAARKSAASSTKETRSLLGTCASTWLLAGAQMLSSSRTAGKAPIRRTPAIRLMAGDAPAQSPTRSNEFPVARSHTQPGSIHLPSPGTLDSPGIIRQYSHPTQRGNSSMDHGEHTTLRHRRGSRLSFPNENRSPGIPHLLR